MSLVKDVFDIIVTLFEFFKKGYLDNAIARKDYFLNHIEPIYQLMGQVHTDYLLNLNELLKIEAKKTKTSTEIIEWLKDRRPHFQFARIRAGKIEQEIFENDYFNKAFKRDSPISKHSLAFLNDIVNYFHRGTNLQHMTWYSYMIQAYEFSQSLEERYPDNAPAGVSFIATSADIVKEIKNTIGTIESQFEFISESYSSLRGICLR